MHIIVISKKSQGVSRGRCTCGWDQLSSNGALAESSGVRHQGKCTSAKLVIFVDGTMQVDPKRRALPGRFGGNPNTGSGMVNDEAPYGAQREIEAA